jgi:leader peptidase (prepilin peptidase)/N-methyltransferase
MITPIWAAYLTVLTFLVGACVGSFLNVCIHRIPREESVVRPRSRCPHCGTTIAWYDNIPLLSFMLLRGKCRHCGGPIAPRYFLVEALTASLFLWIWNDYGLDPRTPVYWLMVSGLMLGMFVDFSHMIIPDRVSLGGIAAGITLSLLVPSLHHGVSALDAVLASLLGAAVGVSLLLIVAWLGKKAFKKDAMGLGDVKLLGAIGAFLGWQGVIFTVMLSSFLGSAVGLSLIAMKHKEWQSRIPYGPYLAIGAVVWILGGYHAWDWYVELMNAGKP